MTDRKKILLHICCAPCMIYPLKKLREDNFEVGGFFYNPNIYPADEYNLREQAVHTYANRTNCDVYFSRDDHPEMFFVHADSHEAPHRCKVCWYLRLKKTAEYARRINVSCFTTTLLISPYQDKLMLKSIGEKVAQQTGLDFYYYDFSQGYKEAVQISKQEGLYRQKYCGCKFSLMERNQGINKNNQPVSL